MPEVERADFLNPLVVPTIEHATAKGQTLALVRPINSQFSYTKKNLDQMKIEREAYASVARQASFFDKELKALEPCPYAFRFSYTTADTKTHSNVCDDWETAAMFYNFNRRYGEKQALELMDKTFNRVFPSKGVVFALGTHSRYPSTWLLVGIIRLDPVQQFSMLM